MPRIQLHYSLTTPTFVQLGRVASDGVRRGVGCVIAFGAHNAKTVTMPWENLVLLVLPVIVVIGMFLQFIRARRDGLRGRSAVVAIFKPVRLLMQGSASAHGLPAPRLEVVDPLNPENNSSQSNS